MGGLNRQLMVITTTGRKSGKKFTIPIGFAPDGRDLLAFNLGGGSNWYKNLLANPQVRLEVMGEKFEAHAEALNTPEQRHTAIEVYKRERPEMFARFFEADASEPTDQLLEKMNKVIFVRFKRA
jgi:deazaflavin-dependent oxidoreductase (nitroreductase family)